MDTRFAISQYPDANEVSTALDALIQKPIYSIKPDALKAYEQEYYEKKCPRSKEMIEQAKTIIARSRAITTLMMKKGLIKKA
jgi:glutamate-1-semialdehyde 2,1-aminomutase